MRHLAALLAAGLLVPLAACATVTVPADLPGGLAADPVLALIDAFSNPRASFDPVALEALLVFDTIAVSSAGEIDRRVAVLGFTAADKASVAPPSIATVDDIRRYGDLAVVIGSVDFAAASLVASVQRTMRVTDPARQV